MVYIQLLIVFGAVLLSVAFFSLFERKVMASTQIRKGPNKVFLVGIFQPFADAVKLVLKCQSSPNSALSFVYFFSPMFFFGLSMMTWILYFSDWVLLNFPSGGLFVLFCFCMSSYGVIFSGWFSNSKYATLGTGRSLAQSISYEIGLTSIFLLVFCFMSAVSLEFFLKLQTQLKLIWPLFFAFLTLLISIFAELNRSPFDLAEGESELVSGYSVEYGGVSYTLIFLSENCSLLWACFLTGVVFLSELCWILIYLSVLVRATVPRIRFDKMMSLFWVNILPLVFSVFILVFSMFSI